MKKLYPDLWQSTLYKGGMLSNYAYVLEHPDGNILFYNTGNESDLQHIESLGGLKYQLLTHRDEAGPSLKRIQQRFGSTLMFSELEATAILKHAQADKFFASDDHQLKDISVLMTPGHTDGSVCFVYKSPHGKTYLFTGDTFFQWEGKWATFVLSGFGGSEAALINSLTKLRDIKPDVVMSSGFIGNVGLVEPTETEWLDAIDTAITSLRKKS
jgi:glyoxylase-like metal-dependent hydrolase (beta-lactamase superfamily II)